MLSSNGQSKAGDYYIVRSEITPHIKPLWEVAARKGGLFNWGRCRIYAYWFDNMTVEYELLDANNKSIANKIVGTWKCENIKIEQGQNAAEATTEISTINAQKLK